MNERQIAIADRLLKILVESDGRASNSHAKKKLKAEFTNSLDSIDIKFVYDILLADYKLITKMGQAFIRLTPEGEKMAKRGMKRYKQKLSFNEWINESRFFALILFLASTIFGSLVSHLMAAILADK